MNFSKKDYARKKKKIQGTIKVDDILDRISTREGLEYYGIYFDKRGFAICPFHNEKTPSFHYDKKRDRYYCFSCNKGGTIIDFVAEYFGYSLPKELPLVLKKIDSDFNLGIDKPLTEEEINRYAEEKKMNSIISAAEDKFKMELKQNYDRWANIYGCLYRTYLENEKSDEELGDLIKQLDSTLDDFSGNELRAWPINSLTEKQRYYVSIAEKELKHREPKFCSNTNNYYDKSKDLNKLSISEKIK